MLPPVDAGGLAAGSWAACPPLYMVLSSAVLCSACNTCEWPLSCECLCPPRTLLPADCVAPVACVKNATGTIDTRVRPACCWWCLDAVIAGIYYTLSYWYEIQYGYPYIFADTATAAGDFLLPGFPCHVLMFALQPVFEALTSALVCASAFSFCIVSVFFPIFFFILRALVQCAPTDPWLDGPTPG